jgi:hypothetical protein
MEICLPFIDRSDANEKSSIFDIKVESSWLPLSHDNVIIHIPCNNKEKDIPTEADQGHQTAMIAEAIRTIYPYKIQIESIRALICDRYDIIPIAKTSFGKSMIHVPQSVSALKRNTTTIMIPLTGLGKEQLQKIQLLHVTGLSQ